VIDIAQAAGLLAGLAAVLIWTHRVRTLRRTIRALRARTFRVDVRDTSGHPVIGYRRDREPTEGMWVWLGAFAGFQILPELAIPTAPDYGQPAHGELHLLLIHRCGWEHRVEFLGGDSYVGNLISGPLITHRVEGCRTP
jgi:hypothetical protein